MSSSKSKARKQPRQHVATIKRHYHRIMPEKKRHRILIWTAFFSYAVILALQMLYPPEKALPLASFEGAPLAWQTEDKLAKHLNDAFAMSTVEIKTQSTTKQYTLGDLKAEPRTDTMIKNLTNYPFWQRFIPFSILWQPAVVKNLELRFTARGIDEISKKVATDLTASPVNARLTIENGKLVAQPDKSGVEIKSEEVKKTLQNLQIKSKKTQVKIDGKTTKAITTSADFLTVKTNAENALARSVTIQIGDTVVTPDKKTIAEWLVIGSDEKGKPLLGFDQKRLSAYFDSVDAKVGHPAGMTNVTLTDGIETARSEGQHGEAIGRSPLNTQIEAWLLRGEGSSPFTTKLHDVAPAIIYDSKYTSTEKGLRAYVADVSSQMDVHIVVQQLDGEGWSAEARGSESVVSASTYKLFIAKRLFDEMDAGRLNWNSPILGTTVSDCFDQMTIASTNACAEEWLRQFGRTNMNNYVYGLGFSTGTTYTNPEANHTTANDLAKFMIGLENGSLIGGVHRDRLLHSLSVHPYRQGVPSGSNGQVWDKVGFLWDYTHDAAIVHHPRGKYVIVVMTRGQSYARIASITREVEKIMYG